MYEKHSNMQFVLPHSRIFSPTIVQTLSDMGYREGIDKIRLKTNFQTETTIIELSKQKLNYKGTEVHVYDIMIPDRYVSNDKPRAIEVRPNCSILNIPYEWIFSKEFMDNLYELGYTSDDSCSFDSMNYYTHITSIRLTKVVNGCKHFEIKIPDQFVEPKPKRGE